MAWKHPSLPSIEGATWLSARCSSPPRGPSRDAATSEGGVGGQGGSGSAGPAAAVTLQFGSCITLSGGSGAGKGEGKVGAALTAFHGLYSRVLLLNTAAVLKWRDVAG